MTLKDRPCSQGRGDGAHQGPGRMRAQCNLVGAGFCFPSLRSRPRKTLLRPHGHPQRAITCEAKGASGTHTQRQLGLAGSRLFAPAKGSQEVQGRCSHCSGQPCRPLWFQGAPTTPGGPGAGSPPSVEGPPSLWLTWLGRGLLED